MDDVTHVTPKKEDIPPIPPEWYERFLSVLSEHGNVTLAAKAARINRLTAYRHRATDEEFARQWELALQLGLDALEDTAKTRALKMSDTLMIFLLKAHRPERYREQPRGGLNLNLGLDDLRGMSDEDLERLKQQLT